MGLLTHPSFFRVPAVSEGTGIPEMNHLARGEASLRIDERVDSTSAPREGPDEVSRSSQRLSDADNLPRSQEPAQSLGATICIPALNESANLSRLFPALREEGRLGAKIEAVLVEASGSTDDTTEVVHREQVAWPIVRLLQQPQRLGLAGALSRMFEMVKTPFVVRLDADVTFPPGTLYRLLQALGRPGVGMVGPRIVPLNSGHRWLDATLSAEYGIHDQVSRISPKLTNLQIFRRLNAGLPHDVEVEDIMLQALVADSGLQAVYVSQEIAYIAPARSLRAHAKQRTRVISQEKWYGQLTGREPPPTARPRIIARAILGGLRENQISPSGLSLFLAIELASRFYVQLQYAVLGHVSRVTWPSAR